MLFHVGALWRLNELGLLPAIQRVSSVSGGSIAAGYLAAQWKNLDFRHDGMAQTFERLYVPGMLRLASRRVDVDAVLKGLLLPGSASRYVAKAYDKYLFKGATLQDLPDSPRFVFNATNVQTGALCRFSKAYIADWRIGMFRAPQIPLATVVASSSSFPPVLSPTIVDMAQESLDADSVGDLGFPPFSQSLVLTDGGVYDNLGLETAWKRDATLLVSDGGAPYGPDRKPKRNWLSHTYRVLCLIDNQVRSLRKRQLIHSYQLAEGDDLSADARKGAYWGIATDIDNYGLHDALPCSPEHVAALASLPTRLAPIPEPSRHRLINWGYAVCDAALRSHFDGSLPPPHGFPFPGGIG